MDFTERLRKLIKATGLNVDAFSGEVSTSRAQVYNYLKGNNEPTATFFQEVKKRFPWVNLEWLVADIGDMIVPDGKMQQTASGNGNIQIGGGGTVSIGKHAKVGKVNESEDSWLGGKFVRISQVTNILEDYMAPKIIKEIEEKLKKQI